MISVRSARAATPGCHGTVFLLSAGSSLPTQRTLDAVIAHLRREAEVGGYAAADEATEVLEQGRSTLATMLGGTPDEIAFTTSDSVAFTKAWWGWVLGGNVAAGQKVLIDRLTYHSHYAAIVQSRSVVDFEIQVLPSTPAGIVDVDQVELDERVAAVCATMVGTHSGDVNPVEELGAQTAAVGVPLFVDACQAVGQMEVDVTSLRCHVLTATGRKFLRGPRGTGVLWVDASLVDRFVPPGIDGVSTAWTRDGLEILPGIERFSEYERSYAALVGLSHAAQQAQELGMAAIEARVGELAEHLRVGLAADPRITVHDTAPRRCGIVTFTLAGVRSEEVVAAAARRGIRINESTSTWAALDMDAKGLGSVVRASPHYFNTHEELDLLVGTVHDLRGR